MSGFRDIYMPAGVVGYPTSGAPRFSTSIVGVSSGDEQRNQNRAQPLHRYTLAEAVRDHATYEALKDHWWAMRGPFYSFPFKDPLDFASVALPAANFAPTVTGEDVEIGAGDGVEREFQLVKPYAVAGLVDTESLLRTIKLPVLSTVLVLMRHQTSGLYVDPSDPTLTGGPYAYTVSRPGGVVTFTPAPHVAITSIKAGFLFDVNVRFESDDAFEGIARNFRVSGFADVVLLEIPLC